VTAPEFLYGTAWKEDRHNPTWWSWRSGWGSGAATRPTSDGTTSGRGGQGLAAAYRAGIARERELFSRRSTSDEPGRTTGCHDDPNAGLRPRSHSPWAARRHLGTTTWTATSARPASGHAWSHDDAEVWGAMARGATPEHRLLGVSNVSLPSPAELATGAECPLRGDRCFASAAGTREYAPSAAARESSTRTSRCSPPNPDVLRTR